MSEQNKITTENYLERDVRLDYWSVHGLGSMTHPTEVWVDMFLSINFKIPLPSFLEEMYERAQACMVYGCHHYPLFTLGAEELFRFGENAFRGQSKKRVRLKKSPRKSILIYRLGLLTKG